MSAAADEDLDDFGATAVDADDVEQDVLARVWRHRFGCMSVVLCFEMSCMLKHAYLAVSHCHGTRRMLSCLNHCLYHLQAAQEAAEPHTSESEEVDEGGLTANSSSLLPAHSERRCGISV